jgi:protein disulfide-isomerase A1
LNEYQQDGFPTILFFPAGNKNFEPVHTTFASKNIILYSSTFLKADINSKLLICFFILSIQITFEGDRTVVEFYKFLKKHASIPFKLKKPHGTPSVAKSESTTDAPATESNEPEKDLKDEL